MDVGPRRVVVLEVAARKQTDRQTGGKACPGRGGVLVVSAATGGMTSTSTSAGRQKRTGSSGVLNECNWTRGPESKRLKAA